MHTYAHVRLYSELTWQNLVAIRCPTTPLQGRRQRSPPVTSRSTPRSRHAAALGHVSGKDLEHVTRQPRRSRHTKAFQITSRTRP
eukprot:2622047-Rhodomonas_salina.2